MNYAVRVLLLSSLLFHAGHASSSAQNKPDERDKELSCEFSLPSEVRAVDGYIDASLVITNISDHLVRICTLIGGWRSVGRTDYTEVLCPDFWKSDGPRPEEFPNIRRHRRGNYLGHPRVCWLGVSVHPHRLLL